MYVYIILPDILGITQYDSAGITFTIYSIRSIINESQLPGYLFKNFNFNASSLQRIIIIIPLNP